MTNSEQKFSALAASRKPRVSTAIDRKMVTRPVRSQSMIARNAEMVVNRSSSQSGQQQMMQKQMQQQQSQQQAQQQVAQKQMQQQAAQQSQQQAAQQSKQQMMQERLMKITNERMQQRAAGQPAPMKQTAQQMKESAIEKALASASRTQEKDDKQDGKVHFGFKRVLLAMAGAAIGVFAIVYFVNLNAPNISLKVAAMQTGIEASYPAFIPRDYTLSDITSEVGKITLNFKNVTTDTSFTLIEEKSSWDSNALLNNYVRYEYGDDYTTLREQGLTLYVSNSSAAWVNGGIVYKLKAPTNTLTKKQIKSIAVSL